MIVILTGNELFHTIDFVKKEHRFELIKMLYEVLIEWKETQPYTRKHPPWQNLLKRKKKIKKSGVNISTCRQPSGLTADLNNEAIETNKLKE